MLIFARPVGAAARKLAVVLMTLILAGVADRTHADEPQELRLEKPSLWRAEPGSGLQSGAKELDVIGGAGLGVRILENHRHERKAATPHTFLSLSEPARAGRIYRRAAKA